MRPLSMPLLVASLVGTVLVAALQASIAREEVAAVVRTVDGDTIVVSIGGKAAKVRLIGVDMPESVDPRRPVEPFGPEGAAYTRRLLEGKRVILRDEIGGQDRDMYGRLLRYVYLEDGTLVNVELIRQGYGRVFNKYPFSLREEFRAQERQARERGLGIWSSGAAARTTQKIGPAGGLYVGSVRGDKYHRPDCEWARKIDSADLVRFFSAADAARRGYRPCKVCKPPAAPSGARRDGSGARRDVPAP